MPIAGTIDTRYSVIISITNASGDQSIIEGFMPQDGITISASSDWSSPIAAAIQQQVARYKIGTAASVLGVSLIPQAATAQMWGGSSPLSMSLELDFYADYNADAEVVSPMMNLLNSAIPDSLGPILLAPGPTAATGFTGAGGIVGSGARLAASAGLAGEMIIIQIGQYLVFRKVVINAVSLKMSSRISFDGRPMMGHATVQFSTYTVLNKAEVRAIFYK